MSTVDSPIAHRPSPAIVDIIPDQWTRPFWDAAKDHRLVAARCLSCSTFRIPPSAFCPICRTQKIDWVELSGHAEVYSFTIIRHAVIPELAETTPYIVAVVKLPDADDAKLMTNIVDCPVDRVHIGQQVTVVWDDVSDGITVPRFTPNAS